MIWASAVFIYMWIGIIGWFIYGPVLLYMYFNPVKEEVEVFPSGDPYEAATKRKELENDKLHPTTYSSMLRRTDYLCTADPTSEQLHWSIGNHKR